MKIGELNPLIDTSNFKNTTHVHLLGVDISRSLTEIEYSHKKDKNPSIRMEIDLVELASILENLTSEDVKKVKEVIQPYCVWLNEVEKGYFD